MARELGMNPKKFGKLANHEQEPWKRPLPQFIEHLYHKRFMRHGPVVVVSIEERARQLGAGYDFPKFSADEALSDLTENGEIVAWHRFRPDSRHGDDNLHS